MDAKGAKHTSKDAKATLHEAAAVVKNIESNS